MRLDLFLKMSRLIPRRTLAKEFCDAGLIEVNGAPAKSGKEVKAGDRIAIKRRNRLTAIEIKNVPAKKQVSRAEADGLYQLLEERTILDDPLS